MINHFLETRKYFTKTKVKARNHQLKQELYIFFLFCSFFTNKMLTKTKTTKILHKLQQNMAKWPLDLRHITRPDLSRHPQLQPLSHSPPCFLPCSSSPSQQLLCKPALLACHCPPLEYLLCRVLFRLLPSLKFHFR